MNIPGSRFRALAAIAACALCAGTGLAQTTPEKPTPDIKLFNLFDPATPKYDVVSRLPGDASAWWVLTYPTRDEAVTALQAEAAKRGADGLVNVTCLDQGRTRWYREPSPAFLCYGIAVRVRSS